jgi:hypothetical protein
MTLVHILGDGSTIPELRKSHAIIVIYKGKIAFGSFNKEKYLYSNEEYVDVPTNMAELSAEILAYINNECAAIWEKKHAVHILCPRSISKKMILINSELA